MAERSDEERREAIRALRRIRAVESEPDGEGIRTVWHQGAKETDLVSYVTREGRVVRQEFTLLGDHFLWTSAEGLRTGTVSGSHGGSKANAASGVVSLDPQLKPRRVLRAADALSTYDGEDKYLLNLKRTLTLTASGLENHEEAMVTRAYQGPTHDPPAPPPGTGPNPLPLVIAGLVLAAALAGVVVYLA